MTLVSLYRIKNIDGLVWNVDKDELESLINNGEEFEIIGEIKVEAPTATVVDEDAVVKTIDKSDLPEDEVLNREFMNTLTVEQKIIFKNILECVAPARISKAYAKRASKLYKAFNALQAGKRATYPDFQSLCLAVMSLLCDYDSYLDTVRDNIDKVS